MYALVNGRYAGLQPVTGGMKISSLRFPQLDFAADEVFEGLPDYGPQ